MAYMGYGVAMTASALLLISSLLVFKASEDAAVYILCVAGSSDDKPQLRPSGWFFFHSFALENGPLKNGDLRWFTMVKNLEKMMILMIAT